MLFGVMLTIDAVDRNVIRDQLPDDRFFRRLGMWCSDRNDACADVPVGLDVRALDWQNDYGCEGSVAVAVCSHRTWLGLLTRKQFDRLQAAISLYSSGSQGYALGMPSPDGKWWSGVPALVFDGRCDECLQAEMWVTPYVKARRDGVELSKVQWARLCRVVNEEYH